MGFKKDAEIKTFLTEEDEEDSQEKTARYTIDDLVRDSEIKKDKEKNVSNKR